MNELDGCTHCAEMAAVVDQVWGGDMISRRPPPAAAVGGDYHRKMVSVTDSMNDCACRCHMPARIVGKLPRLVASP